MKKILLLSILSLLTASTFLTSCGGDKPTEPNREGSSTSSRSSTSGSNSSTSGGGVITNPEDITLENSLEYRVLPQDTDAVPSEIRTLANRRGHKMVLIPAKGRVFRMGAPDDYSDGLGITRAKPSFLVTFTYNYYMRETPVHCSEFQTVINWAVDRGLVTDSTWYSQGFGYMSRLYNTEGQRRRLYGDTKQAAGMSYDHNNNRMRLLPNGARHVAYMISWYGAAFFCNMMSRRDGFEEVYNLEDWSFDLSKNGYRLPTEAEWEYAYRAGTTTMYFWGDELGDNFEYAEPYITRQSKIVGQMQPNPFGLYNLLSFVEEWCNDWYGPYTETPKIDPWGVTEEESYVKHGVNHGYRDKVVRAFIAESAGRVGRTISYFNDNTGFRYVLPIRE